MRKINELVLKYYDGKIVKPPQFTDYELAFIGYQLSCGVRFTVREICTDVDHPLFPTKISRGKYRTLYNILLKVGLGEKEHSESKKRCKIILTPECKAIFQEALNQHYDKHR